MSIAIAVVVAAADDAGGTRAMARCRRMLSRVPSNRSCRRFTPDLPLPTRLAAQPSTSSTFLSRPNGPAPTLVEAAPVVPDPATAAASPIILDEPEPAQAQAMSGEAEALKSPDLEEQGTSPEPIEAPEPDRLPEPEPVPANDVAPEPLVKPIIVGGDQEAVVEKKRGWWRR